MENMELQHHGIKGMRWGVRRYQNKDGTLTAKGKKRYAAEMEKLKNEETILKNKQRTQAKVDRLIKKRQELDDLKKKLAGDTDDKHKSVKSQTSSKPKTISEMSDEELAARINRLRLEQTYKQLSPAIPSKGEKFINNILKPAGKTLTDKLGNTILDKVNKEMRDKFGLDVDEKKMNALKKEFDTLDYKRKIAQAKADIKKAEGGESEYDRLKREADIAGFETRIRNNEKSKNVETSTINDIPSDIKNSGRKWIQTNMFDYIDE